MAARISQLQRVFRGEWENQWAFVVHGHEHVEQRNGHAPLDKSTKRHNTPRILYVYF